MYEVEVKLRAAHGPVRAALRDADAEPLGTVVQADTYHDAPHRDFAETDEALRIRREWEPDATETETVRLTYKGPLVDETSKSREERETGVEDADAMAAVLAALGFEPVETVRKERERYSLDDYLVTLDAVDGLGEFVEVETEAEEVGPARDGAFDLLERLGLDPAEQTRTSYLAMLLGRDI